MNSLTKYSQNFLCRPQVVKSLLERTNLGPHDTVYDIGGGKGIIAAALAARCHTVISVEIDPHLARKLQVNMQPHCNVVVYEADFLTLPLPQTPYKVFANIPFNLSADIVRKLTSAPYPPAASYLIVQREFAEKLAPKPGGYHSQLATMLAVQFELRTTHRLRSSDFYPRPRVTPVLLEIILRPCPLVAEADVALFRDFTAYIYNACKANIGTSLSSLFDPSELHELSSSGLTLTATPAQLEFEQWLRLFERALQKRSRLERLAGGYEALLTSRHENRTKVHKTRF